MKKDLFIQNLLYENIVIIDGFSRAGKFLLGKIVSNLHHAEAIQYEPIIEHIPIFHHLGRMDRETSIMLLRQNLNMFIYNRAIGRGLNLKKSDSSSIYNALNPEIYFERANLPDEGMIAIDKITKEKRILTFLTHESSPFLDMFYEAVPKLKIINIQRHPIDLISSWHTRNWGARFGVDPLSFYPTIKVNENLAAPWFADSFFDDYANLKPIDIVIQCLHNLFKMDKVSTAKHKNNPNFLMINYESFFQDHYSNIEKMEAFLQVTRGMNFDETLRREGCFGADLISERRKKFAQITKICKEENIPKIVELSHDYDRLWNQESIF